MKPTDLTPSQRVLITPSFGQSTPYHGTFIRRVPRQQGLSAYSVFLVDEFAGLNGPDDPGNITCSDHYISRHVQPLEMHA
ncbi:hypothetical protein BHJ67_000864 [Escherichia coli]|uniref:hypothetical protein n=1 Tax=Escherichia coli TaxID=562 RepID=UPI0003EF00CA|nr:hypothetical protein [Escherichia coli]DAU86906.1 MAG TPA: hypothetical protein [Caudoviricetes sp.]EEQ6524708.1 hypothetical protein [Escherichia coli]EEQ9687461.1 hypothetical protein [Escherichia coli]EEQ9771960.1 hypothetical protein [Escherichia coli]EFA9668202.1 hypothetical protein [Escherichia coli]